MTENAKPVRPKYSDEMRRFVRFVVVGVLNTLFGYIVFVALWYALRNNTAAVMIGTAINVTFNYFTTGRFVFANTGFKTLLPYFGGYAIVMLLNIAAIEGLTRLGFSAPIAGLIALPFLVLTSYAYNSLVVFKRPKP